MVIRVLVVDDHEVTRKLLQEVLTKQGYSVQLAANGEEAVRLIQSEEFPVVISDIRMIELDGMAVLREVKKKAVDSAVILMTGFGSMGGAIQAIQEGAFDYVSKPFKMDDLKAIVARAVKHWELLQTSRAQSGPGTPPERPYEHSRGVIGKSPQIVEVFKVLARAAMSNSTVLIEGEKGTGKELVARAIHENGSRRSKNFVAFNCGPLEEHLLEGEFFRLLELARGSSLFIDEIGDFPPALQIKLLRLLEEGEFQRKGAQWKDSSDAISVDVRIIAATQYELDRLVKQGKFREDLYYRLKVISIKLPPLRERMEDLPELIHHFLVKSAEKNNKLVSHVSEDAMLQLKNYSWPGNVRELELAIERAVAMSNAQVLFSEDFGIELTRSEGAPSNAGSLEEVEKAYILKVLEAVQYNKSKASGILGIDRATLYRKAQRYAIHLRGK